MMKTRNYEYRLISDGDGQAVAYRTLDENDNGAGEWRVTSNPSALPPSLLRESDVRKHFE